MVEITVNSETAIFEVSGWDKVWALRSRLEIPLIHIRAVRSDPEAAQGWWHGIKAPGTNVPRVITAGTFYQHGRRVFWDVHEPARTIVIELSHEHYDELVIEVADPAGAVVLREKGLGEAHGFGSV